MLCKCQYFFLRRRLTTENRTPRQHINSARKDIPRSTSTPERARTNAPGRTASK